MATKTSIEEICPALDQYHNVASESVCFILKVKKFFFPFYPNSRFVIVADSLFCPITFYFRLCSVTRKYYLPPMISLRLLRICCRTRSPNSTKINIRHTVNGWTAGKQGKFRQSKYNLAVFEKKETKKNKRRGNNVVIIIFHTFHSKTQMIDVVVMLAMIGASFN